MRYQKGELKVVIDLSKVFEAVEKTKYYGIEDEDGVEVDLLSTDEALVTIPIYCEVEEHFTKGCYTLPNGDPGYPDEYDVEVKGDYKEFNKNLAAATVRVEDIDSTWDDEEVYGDYPEEW